MTETRGLAPAFGEVRPASLLRSVRAELIALGTLRSPWWLGLIIVLIAVVFAAIGVVFSPDAAAPEALAVASVASGAVIAPVLALAAGIAFPAEVTEGVEERGRLSQPRARRRSAAKVFAVAIAGLLVSLVALLTAAVLVLVLTFGTGQLPTVPQLLKILDAVSILAVGLALLAAGSAAIGLLARRVSLAVLLLLLVLFGTPAAVAYLVSTRSLPVWALEASPTGAIVALDGWASSGRPLLVLVAFAGILTLAALLFTPVRGASFGSATSPTRSVRRAVGAPVVLPSRTGFRGALRSELLAQVTVRSTRFALVGLGLLLLLSAALSAGQRNVFGVGPREAAIHETIMDVGLGHGAAQFIVMMFAALAVAGEYRRGAIDVTLLAVPRRARMVFARSTALALITAAATAPALAAASFLVVPTIHRQLGIQAELVGVIDRMLPVLTGSAVLALIAVLVGSLGGILRSMSATVITAVALLVVLPSLSTLLYSLTGDEGFVLFSNIAEFLPSNGLSLTWYSSLERGAVRDHSDYEALQLSPVEGGVVLLAWTLLVLGVWLLTFVRGARRAAPAHPESL